jgi:hypothetical protein
MHGGKQSGQRRTRSKIPLDKKRGSENIRNQPEFVSAQVNRSPAKPRPPHIREMPVSRNEPRRMIISEENREIVIKKS